MTGIPESAYATTIRVDDLAVGAGGVIVVTVAEKMRCMACRTEATTFELIPGVGQSTAKRTARGNTTKQPGSGRPDPGH